jgi:hypothetical protein
VKPSKRTRLRRLRKDLGGADPPKKKPTEWTETDMGNGVRKRVRRADATAAPDAEPTPSPTPSPAPQESCPLKPDLAVADVSSVIVHAAVAHVEPGSLAYGKRTTLKLVVIGHADPRVTADELTERHGGGIVYLAFIKDRDNTSDLVGEVSVLLPGLRSDSTRARIKTESDLLISRSKNAEARRLADEERAKVLHADEDVLILALAEIHHAVVHARFAADATEANGHLAKALGASERGIETMVKRLRDRPMATSSIWAILGGFIPMAYAVYAMLKPKTKS